MSSATPDLISINNGPIPDEINAELEANTLLYPIGKAFMERFPQYHDIIRTYENSVESIIDIICKDKVLDDFISIDDTTSVHFRAWVENAHIYPPDSIEAAKYSKGYIPTPNHALVAKGMYAAVIIGDWHYGFEYIYKHPSYDSYNDMVKSINAANLDEEMIHEVIPNGYVVNIPIPIGCKWCALNHFDDTTLIKSGEEMKSLYGYFIVDGLFRFIISIYKAPFNKPIIIKNNFDDQLSRTELLHTKGYEYEDSYHMVGAMVTQKLAHVGRGGATPSPPDMGFALQLQHPLMYSENSTNGKRSHKLYNFVPIKFLFGAFGCTTDEELIGYICPDMNDFGLINMIRQACLNGYKHKEAIQKASIKVKPTPYLAYESPLTEFDCKYIIGCLVLKEPVKAELLNKCNHNEKEYKLFVAQTVTTILDERFMPGIGDNTAVDRNTAVCVELGLICKQLYLIGYGLEASQDKTALTNRRVRMGQQMSREFKAFHGVRLREILAEATQTFTTAKSREVAKDAIISKMESIVRKTSQEQTDSIINAFKGTSKEQSKLRTDIIACKNQAFIWNKLREIVISSDTKATGTTVTWEHRTVHQSELYFICPTQTPESGKETGRYKTPTLYTYVTIATKGLGLLKIVQNHPGYMVSIRNSGKSGQMYVIRLNGSCIGYIPQYKEINHLYEELLAARADGRAEVDASIIMNHTIGYLDIWTDTGRLVSPFVSVKRAFDLKYKETGDLRLTGTMSLKPDFKEWLLKCALDIDQFEVGLKKRYIEYMDTEMCINNAVIAPSLKEFYEKPSVYTHIALPMHTHGIIASIPPAMNLNAGVRCSYLTNHVKQAIGPVLRYPQLKYIGDHNILVSPQIPMVRPCSYNFLHMNEVPIGNNVVLAFLQFKYNQEDAIILNRTSVEQGLLKIDSISTKDYKIDKNEEEYKIPDSGTVLSGNPESYAKIDPVTALPKRIGELFWEKDVLISKILKRADGGESDNSIINDKPDGKFPPSANPRPLRCVVKNKAHGDARSIKKQVFGQYRCPLVGDKFNSEHAQKGTCGKIMDPEDLPYTKTGIRPDVIFNPPAIFKRKTYGQLYIAMMSKIATLLGCQIDCTPYHTIRTDDDLFKILKDLGLDDAGYETMYDGETNRPYKARIFVGMHYWERQSHLVETKLNVRNGGSRVAETQQPMKGKKHQGGQSADRMTFDCHIAAGINEIVRDLHLNMGSNIKIGICKRCHSIMGYYNEERHEWICPRCGAHPDFIIRHMPHASGLMNHIMNGMHISVDYFDSLDIYTNDQEYDVRSSGAMGWYEQSLKNEVKGDGGGNKGSRKGNDDDDDE